MNRYYISNDGKRWTVSDNLELSVDIADAIKGQVFLLDPNAVPPAGLTIVYSHGEKAALVDKEDQKYPDCVVCSITKDGDHCIRVFEGVQNGRTPEYKARQLYNALCADNDYLEVYICGIKNSKK